MAVRNLTVKRIDPWSVLKFGLVANVAAVALFLLIGSVAWYIIDRLQIVDQVCGLATDVGFTRCGFETGELFGVLLQLGALMVVIFTALLVFMAFLYNLIADLTGGIVLRAVEPGGGDAVSSERLRTVEAAAAPTPAHERPSEPGILRRAVAARRAAVVVEEQPAAQPSSVPQEPFVVEPESEPALESEPVLEPAPTRAPAIHEQPDEDLFRGR